MQYNNFLSINQPNLMKEPSMLNKFQESVNVADNQIDLHNLLSIKFSYWYSPYIEPGSSCQHE